MSSKWIYQTPSAEQMLKGQKLGEELHIHPALATLLVQRGIDTFHSAKNFFRPQLSQLYDPFLMNDMDRAVKRLNDAIGRKERILVYGDYDVDGTTAVALVYKYLQHFYSNIDYYIPDRYEEGYGVSVKGVDYAADTGVKLVIVLDCGIKAVDEIAYAKAKGIDFIICDHHVPDDVLPDAVAILNPKRHDSTYPYPDLSGCGVGFKFMQAFAKDNGLSFNSLTRLLDMVAVSIAADIVPVMGENRVLAYHGLRQLNNSPSTGLKAIIRKALAVNPDDRYASVTELSEDIRRHQNGLSISARPDDIFMKSARFAARHLRSMLMILLVFMLGAVSLGAYSVYDRLRIANEMSLRSSAMNAVYGKTAAAAAAFDMTALHMQDLLCAVSQAAGHLLGERTGRAQSHSDAFYPYRPGGGKPDELPPDLVYSAFHKRRTTFSHGVYKIAPGADLTEVRKFLSCMTPILSNMLHAVLESRPGIHLTPQNLEEQKKEWLEHGLPVKAVFAASKHGVTMLFPWRDTYTEGYDPRNRPWYRRALQNPGPVWGRPYVDEDSASGLSIPCSMQIRDIQGNFHGVAGLDLSFNKLTGNLLSSGNTGAFVLEKAVMNPEGRVVLSASSEYFNRTFDPEGHEDPELALPLFRDETVRSRILGEQQGFGLFVNPENGREVLYSFARLKIFKLYYVEVIDFSRLLRQSAEKKQ